MYCDVPTRFQTPGVTRIGDNHLTNCRDVLLDAGTNAYVARGTNDVMQARLCAGGNIGK